MSGCCALPNIFRAKIRLKTSHLFTFPSDWQKLGKPYGSVAKKGKNSSSLIENKSPKAHSSLNEFGSTVIALQKLLHSADLRRFLRSSCQMEDGSKTDT